MLELKEKTTLGFRFDRRDPALVEAVGKFPHIAPQEIAELLGRSQDGVWHRIKRMCEEGLMERIALQQFGPKYVHLTAKGYDWYPGPHIFYHSKSPLMVPHDRALTEVHLAYHKATDIDWEQRDDEVEEVVKIDGKEKHFWPDAIMRVADFTNYLENTRSNPRSGNGNNDLYDKLPVYNELLRDSKSARVIFIFRDSIKANNFIKKAREQFPYHWLTATTVQLMTENPLGNILLSAHSMSAHSVSGEKT